MLLKQIRKFIIRPSLQCVALWSDSIEVLLMGTILVESEGECLRKINNAKSIGYGLYQIDQAAHKDTKLWLSNRMNKNMIDRVLAASYMAMLPTDEEPLIYNLRYATLIARIIYYRNKQQVPCANDAVALSEYYKSVYNTQKWKSDICNIIPIFQKVIDESELD